MTTFTPTPLSVVELALSTAPTEAPSWVDVSLWVESWSFRRGRQGPLESVGAGGGTLRLSNLDRRWDPTYEAGPYFGTLKSTRRGRIRAVRPGIDGAPDTLYDLMHFYIDAWALRRENYGNQYAEVTFSDAIKVLALAKVTATRPEERTDERIAALLTALPWTTGQAWLLADPTYGVLGATTVLAPVGDRALDQGDVRVQAVTLTRESVLSHLQAAERSEFGALFPGKDGAITFHNRTRRLLAGSTASVATFGDRLTGGDSGELAYAEVEFAYDEAELWNDVSVTREGGVAQTRGDAGSQQDHFVRSLDWSTLSISDSESGTLAGYLVNRYAQQRLRITALTLDPEDGTGAVWPQLLGRELGDVITVRATPLNDGGGTGRIEQVSFIEGIALDWRAPDNDWGRPVWSLSPADTTRYWILGVSLLGVDTYLGL